MKYEGIHPIEEWDRQIAGFAASLVAKRLSALHKLAFLAGVLHKRLSRGQEMLDLTYVQPYGGGDRSHQTDPEWYYTLLQRHLEEDVRVRQHPSALIGTTSSFPSARQTCGNTVPRDSSGRPSWP